MSKIVTTMFRSSVRYVLLVVGLGPCIPTDRAVDEAL